MIHLDASYIIRGAHTGTAENEAIKKWLGGGEHLGISVVAWMEFVTGPLESGAETFARALLDERIEAFGIADAELAARLYNLAGRRRALRYDCMIAAAAISAGAELATRNTNDFQLFTRHGLTLAT